MFCDNCGKKLDEEDKFCEQCGAKIIITHEVEGRSDLIRDTKKRKKIFISPMPIGSLGVFFIFLIISGISYYLYNQNSKTQDLLKSELIRSGEQISEANKQIETLSIEIQGSKEKIAETNKNLELSNKIAEDTIRALTEKISIIQTPVSIEQDLVSVVASEKKYVVKVVCALRDGGAGQGSGVIIGKTKDNHSIILTAYHVTEGATANGIQYPCIIGYSENPTTTFTDYYYAQPVFWSEYASESTMKNFDFSYLEVKSKIDKNLNIISSSSLVLANDAHPKVCDSTSFNIGEEVVILGYAGIAGSYLSSKDGIISELDNPYIVTSAKIEHGDSGGGAFLVKTGCLIGLPVFSQAGEIESFGRILVIPYISPFLIRI